MEIPEDYAQANFKFAGNGVPLGAECTLGVYWALSSYDNPTDVAEQLHGFWVDNVLPDQSSAVALSSTSVKFGPNNLGPSGEFSGYTAGGRSDSGLNPQVAYLVRKNTLLGGHAGRGRLYVPGVPEEAQDPGGNIDASVVASLQSGFDAFFGDCIVAGLIPVLLHNSTSPLATPSPMTGFQVDAKSATQRRRNRR